MNLKLVLNLVGRVMQVEAGAMVLPLITAVLYRENAMPFVWTILLLLAIGTILAKLKSSKQFYACEGFLSVGLIWLVVPLPSFPEKSDADGSEAGQAGCGSSLPEYFRGNYGKGVRH